MQTAWRPMLVLLLEWTLPRAWKVVPEFLLSRQPQRIDAVIALQRTGDEPPPEPEYLRSLRSDLQTHSLVHFKGLEDELEISDVRQRVAYGWQYANVASVADLDDIGLRMLAPRMSPRYAAEVERCHSALTPTVTPGMHEGHVGGFRLRMVEGVSACRLARDHLLYTFTDDYLREPGGFEALEPHEQEIMLARCYTVQQFRRDSKWRDTMKGTLEVNEHFDALYRKILAMIPVEDRLARLMPEQRLAGLDEVQQILALSDVVLRTLPDSVFTALPGEAQQKIRARIGRPLPST